MSSQVKLPLGVRFIPSNKTLISDYLMPKVKNEQLPCTGIIIEDQDLYSDVPWKLMKEEYPFELDYKGDNIVRTFYVFTHVTKVGLRYSRTVGNHGTWKGETGIKKVHRNSYNVNGQKEKVHIGFKRLLKFQASNEDRDLSHGDWIMHEYSLGEVSLGELGLGFPVEKELVICKVKQTIPKASEAMKNPNSLTSVVMVSNKRKLTSESDLPGEPTKKNSDCGRSTVSNGIPSFDKGISDPVEPAMNNTITCFNINIISDRVTSPYWPNATISFNNRTSDLVGPVSINNGTNLDIGEENFSVVPDFDENECFSLEELQNYDYPPSDMNWILTNCLLQQPNGSMGSNFNFPPNPSQCGYAMDYVTQGAQGGSAANHVTLGAQGDFHGSFLNLNSQSGCSPRVFSHGFNNCPCPQDLFTQVGSNDPSQDDVSQGHFGTNPLQTQTQGLMNSFYSQPFNHYITQPSNMQHQQQQQSQQEQGSEDQELRYEVQTIKKCTSLLNRTS